MEADTLGKTPVLRAPAALEIAQITMEKTERRLSGVGEPA